MHLTQDKNKVLDIHHLSIRHGDKCLIDDLSLDIEKGKITCLIGESGAGKSLLAHALMGLNTHGLEIDGHINLAGSNVLSFTDKQWQKLRGNRISMIFQDPLASLNPCQLVKHQLAEMIQIHQPGAASIDALENLMTQVELDPVLLNRYPHQLSGGQRQRVMIAAALANQPELLIADECTTALDVTTQKQILDLLKKLVQETGLTVFLITHNLNVVKYLADQVYILRTGQLVESCSAEQLKSPKAAYTKSLLTAYQLPTLRGEAQETCLFTADGIDVHAPQTKLWGRDKQLTLVKNIHFSLYKKRNLGIVGESGAGKTSLARALLGLLPLAGKVTPPLQHGQFQYVFQDSCASLNPRYTIEQTLTEASMLASSEKSLPLHQILKDVGLTKALLPMYPYQLSGGQKQRINLARALLTGSDILILDEPTSALDAGNQLEVLKLLVKVQEMYGLTYILITHDIQIVQAFCHDVLVLRAGNVIDIGNTHEIFHHRPHQYITELLSASFL